MSKAPKRKDIAFPQPTSAYEMRVLRDCKTVWLRAYCAAIESFVPKEAADIADAAVKAFTKRFYA